MQHLMAVIEDAIYLRDLGVDMANDLTFRVHLANVVTGGKLLRLSSRFNQIAED